MSEQKKPSEVIEFKIRGAVTEPKCWSARYFAEFAVNLAPLRYAMDVKLLFELEWIYLKRKLIGNNVKVPGMGEPACAVWANEEYIGDDVKLCKYLKKDGYIDRSSLITALNVIVQISMDPLDHCPRDVNRAYVYFNVLIDGVDAGRMIFELYTDLMPVSCERFLKECKRYDGSAIHRIAHGGWFESGRFDEEDNPIREKRSPGLSNCREGMLSLVNTGKTNCKSSTFLVTLVPAKHLDPYQCPIGALLDGDQVLNAIEQIETHYDSPLQKVNIHNVTILHAPRHIVEKNNLHCLKFANKPATVWLQSGKIRRKPDDDQVKNFRIDLDADYRPVETLLDQQLGDITKQLYRENKKLQEIKEEPGFKKIIGHLLEVEKAGRKELDIKDIKTKGEKWFNILLNADSDFDLYYKPSEMPEIPGPKDTWLQMASILENPTVIRLLQFIKERDLNTVINIIVRLIEEAISAAVVEKDHELFAVTADRLDYSKPFGDELEKLPESIQELLLEEVCNLSNTAFDLFKLTLKFITANVSGTLIDNTSTISGDIMQILDVTKSMLSAQSLTEQEIVIRKTTLMEDIKVLTGSMVSIHERSKSEPIRLHELEVQPVKVKASTMSI